MSVDSLSSPETPAPVRLEEQLLSRLGFEHLLDAPGKDPGITGRNFLDGYGNSPRRAHTEAEIASYLGMTGTEGADYDDFQAYISEFVVNYLGTTS